MLAAGQVGRGLLFPVASQNPAVVEACTKAQMAVLGLVPTTTGHPPPHTMFVPPSVPGLPPVVRDPFGVPRQQGGPQATSSGGDQGRPTGPVRRSSRGGSAKSSIPVPTHTSGGAAQRAASTTGKKLSSREQKLQRKYILWSPSDQQLRHAHLLLRGDPPYKMVPPECLKATDSRVDKKSPNNKWLCTYCERIFSSQRDAQGHILAQHGGTRSPPLCGCRVNVFNSAKALWDHLHLMHNINPAAVKDDPPVPLLYDSHREMRTPPEGSHP